jgi:hypothetical protein
MTESTVDWFIVKKNTAEWLTDSAGKLKRTRLAFVNTSPRVALQELSEQQYSQLLRQQQSVQLDSQEGHMPP